MASEIIAEINKLNNDDDPTNDVKELNIVSHSMGAAYAEGMIEEFMKDDQLKKLLENGQVIHLSAADANKIVISDNSKSLNRSQLNYANDKTLAKADPGSSTYGGWRIPGVQKFGYVASNLKELHPKANANKYDLHYDSKAFEHTWYFLRALDSQFDNQKSSKAIELRLNDIQDYIPADDSNPKS